MKATEECYYCLAQLVRQAAELATDNSRLRTEATEEAMSLLDREFSTDKTSIAVATVLHRVVREITGNTDPYVSMKQAEINMAEELCRGYEADPGSDFRSCVILAVRGNNIDFFKDLVEIKEDLAKPVHFVIDDLGELEAKLERAKDVLYLADNTGEVFFDLPLVRKLGDYAAVTYVVKESAVQNDITIDDLDRFGLRSELGRVITTGTDTPGVDMDKASDEFRLEFEAADLVLAKGMGYWEALTELSPRGKVFHLLKAKCRPVADSLGVGVNSYVAVLR